VTLSAGVNALRGQFTPRSLGWVNKASGIIIAAFGLLALASAKI
jgi:hypothetical protein